MRYPPAELLTAELLGVGGYPPAVPAELLRVSRQSGARMLYLAAEHLAAEHARLCERRPLPQTAARQRKHVIDH